MAAALKKAPAHAGPTRHLTAIPGSANDAETLLRCAFTAVAIPEDNHDLLLALAIAESARPQLPEIDELRSFVFGPLEVAVERTCGGEEAGARRLPDRPCPAPARQHFWRAKAGRPARRTLS